MRFGFWVKAAALAGLVALGDWLFGDDPAGTMLGLFALGWLAAVVVARPDVRRSRLALGAVAAALVYAAMLVDDPGPLAWLMFWAALAMAALLPRVTRFDDAWRWAWRLGLHAASSAVVPLRDLRALARPRRAGRMPAGALAGVLALPLVGGLVFVALFAGANPLIGAALADIRLPSPGRLLFWTVLAALAWPSMRPHAAVLRWAARLPDPEPRLPGTSLPSVLIALALFNALFAVQNLLDIAFLWSGAALPAGMSQTEYVHRGAYPLIVTALLAGAMALAMLRPGSESARHPLARRLVTLWVAQNVVLVASSALRTIDYIATSMLTAWRIAALAWMALVALGLVLIGWRILRDKSARWLVNTNAAAALAVLTAAGAVDLGAVAAWWNVRAADVRGIDLEYLHETGDGALLPLVTLEARVRDPELRARVHGIRMDIQCSLAGRQAQWRAWTPRGARRLAAAPPVACGRA
ncbi:DUF4173 domain-containing protein [Sphingomonas sp. KR1UV-12]|uniref:DUF4173 domain-containing protein n=1 Tax=Sphingomonas aurea TaxID=3063994 RepID=A0ABT9EM22_9SPHN|nr:DUF4173 domain-containing protein [Sphingomonas sp. KR1UV-12]MDP1027838.1 DUF4173 domain-containing protein [Sphingomonas sp. KR1UV-12]